MILNGLDIGIGKIEANSNNIIIYSKYLDKSICLNFNNYKLDLNNIKENEGINLIKYLYWDTNFNYKDSSLLFDISNSKITLTKINKKEFKLFIDINLKDIDIIYFYEKSIKFDLKTLLIDCILSFN